MSQSMMGDRLARTQAKILEVLAQEGFLADTDTVARLDHFLSSLSRPDVGERTLEILAWLDELRSRSTMNVEPTDLHNLQQWTVDAPSGAISHASGQFFRIEGIRVRAADEREQSNWDQPIIYQPEMGILGIARKKMNGVWHYLMQAKAEPGNIGGLQISPTLQSTWSNLKQAHGGQKSLFADYFERPKPGSVVYMTHQTEDGARFYQKSNLNIIIEVGPDDMNTIPDHFRWLTMADIKQLLKHDNTVNLYVRSIISPL
jgi:dTDP-4-dehydro-6-deoxy-alpha-D-glucopyranose 2,3-dehydratase